MPAIGFNPEYIARIGSFLIPNSLYTAWVVSAFIVLFSCLSALRIRGVFGTNVLQRAMEIILQPLWKFVRDVLEHEETATAVFPFIATFFIFIFTANFVEILPGFLGSFGIREGGEMIPLFRSPSTDLNTTVALALISVVVTQLFAIRFIGFKKWFAKFINITSPLKAVLGIFEAVGEMSKVLSFSFRLFGNMFAGSVLLLVIGFLIPYIIPLPFMFLEMFVGLVQALIFSILSLMFIKAALSH